MANKAGKENCHVSATWWEFPELCDPAVFHASAWTHFSFFMKRVTHECASKTQSELHSRLSLTGLGRRLRLRILDCVLDRSGNLRSWQPAFRRYPTEQTKFKSVLGFPSAPFSTAVPSPEVVIANCYVLLTNLDLQSPPENGFSGLIST